MSTNEKLPRLTKRALAQDLQEIVRRARDYGAGGYMLQPKDIFAFGYMCGKYHVSRLIDNQQEVIDACQRYDETDDLALLDTIGETLIDLKVITNEKGEL